MSFVESFFSNVFSAVFSEMFIAMILTGILMILASLINVVSGFLMLGKTKAAGMLNMSISILLIIFSFTNIVVFILLVLLTFVNGINVAITLLRYIKQNKL